MNNWNLTLLVYVLSLQVIVLASMVLDIPFIRQVSGFVLLAIIPGFLFLRILRSKKFDVGTTFLLSVGLSLALLLLIGALMNLLGTLSLVSQPLSFVPMTIIVNVVVCIMNVLSYLRNRDIQTFEVRNMRFSPLLCSLILPIMSIAGVLLVGYFHNNMLSLAVVIVISAVFVVSILSSRASPKLSSYHISSYHILILLSIVLSLVLSQALSSNYLYGDDIHDEFNTFLATKNVSYWNPQNNSYVQQSSDNSMMSITVLPTILSNLLNINADWLFKIVFPIFFLVVPLGLYQLYRRYWGERSAFVSVIFFVANFAFFAVVLTNSKQMIGEIFFVLLFLVLFSKNTDNSRNKWIIFAILFFGLMVSHYSMTYMFLLFVFFAWLGGRLLWKPTITRISGSLVAFSACLSFLWYAYIIQPRFDGPFGKFVGVIQTTIVTFSREFFSLESRGGDVQAALGSVARPTAIHYVGTLLYDLTILLILIGFVSLIVKWRRGKFDSAFFSVISLAMGLLVLVIVVPNFAGFLELGRLYHILLLFLSPLFVLGIEAFVSTISRLRAPKNPPSLNDEEKKTSYCLILTSIILLAFFLFQTGLVYEVTRDPVPSSIALSRYRMENYSFGLIHESDVSSASWLSQYGRIENTWTFADSVSISHVLDSYSAVDRGMILLLSNTTGRMLYGGTYDEHNSFFFNLNTTYIYLSSFSIAEEKVPFYVQKNIYYDFDEIPILNNTDVFVNRIYSNGKSENLYRVP